MTRRSWRDGLLEVGVGPDLSPRAQEQVRLLNHTIVISTGMIVVLLGLVAFIDHPVRPYSFAVALAALAGSGVGQYFMARRRYTLGYSIYGCVSWACCATLVVLFGVSAGFHLVLLSGPGGGLMTVGRRAFARVGYYLWPLLAVSVALLVWGSPDPVLGRPLTPEELSTLNAANFAVIFLALWRWNSQSARTRHGLEDQVQEEKEVSEGLLLNILPASIAERMKSGEESIADAHPRVAVLFCDLVGFTAMAADRSPREIVDLLERLFLEFDDLASRHGLEKIKTLGDGYLAAAGLPDPVDDPETRAVRMALGMREAVRQLGQQLAQPLDVRIGVHSGPVVAGVIGKSRFAYDLWGDTVNTASRLESRGVAGAIQISEAVRRHLPEEYSVQDRGEVELKGKGRMRCFLVDSPGAESSPTGPDPP